MSGADDLSAKIDAFLAKYPDDCAMEWADKRPKTTPARSALEVMVADVVEASERRRRLSP